MPDKLLTHDRRRQAGRLPVPLSGCPQKNREGHGRVTCQARRAEQWYRKFDKLLGAWQCSEEIVKLLDVDVWDPVGNLIRALLCVYFVPLTKRQIIESKFPFQELPERANALATDLELFLQLYSSSTARFEQAYSHHLHPNQVPEASVTPGQALRMLPEVLRMFSQWALSRALNVQAMAENTKTVRSRAVICLFDVLKRTGPKGPKGKAASTHAIAKLLIDPFNIGAAAAGTEKSYDAVQLIHLRDRYIKDHRRDYEWTLEMLHSYEGSKDSRFLDALFVSPIHF